MKKLLIILVLLFAIADLQAGNGDRRINCRTIRLHQAHATQDNYALNKTTGASNRPVIRNEKILTTRHFDIHFTISGTDAVPVKDLNTNRIPDYIDAINTTYEEVYSKDSVEKYYMPPADNRVGGSSRYDIYVYDIGAGNYGYVDMDDSIGDNPRSPMKETDAWTSFASMNCKLPTLPGVQVDTALKVTAAHEFYHAIQYGYTSLLTEFWMEASAVWMETHLYPQLEDNYQYLPDFLNHPDASISWDPYIDTAYGLHHYGAWLFLKYIEEQASPAIIKNILDSAVYYYELEELDYELYDNYSLDLNDVSKNFFIALDLMQANPADKEYALKDAARYKKFLKSWSTDLAKEGSFDFKGTPINWSSKTNGNKVLMRQAADYFRTTANADITISLTPEKPEYDLALLVLMKNTKTGAYSTDTGVLNGSELELTVPYTTDYDEYTIIVMRREPLNNNFNSYQYTLNIKGNNNAVTEANTLPIALKLFPNPVTDYLQLNYNLREGQGRYRIYDVAGKLVEQKEQLQAVGQVRIPTSQWKAGVYILYFEDEKGNASAKKFNVIRP